MDIHKLDKAVRHYFTAALATSSHKTYKAAEHRYSQFCQDFSITPFPTSECILCYFATCLAEQGLAHSTVKTYLSGVRQVQVAMGFGDPNVGQMPRLRQILRGIAVEAGKRSKAPRARLPITPTILRKMKAEWFIEKEGTSYKSSLLWAASTTNFFSFYRSGELTVPRDNDYDPNTHLSLGDLQADHKSQPSTISLLIKQSKTDQTRKGVTVVISKTGDELCPVSALLHYLALRGNKPGPLFQWEDGSPLSKPRFVKEVRAALTAAKLPAHKFAGHSFRRGAATTAAMAGIQDSTIQTLGRWKSSAYLLYIKIHPKALAQVSPVLSRCPL